jgi:hypothetical protein
MKSDKRIDSREDEEAVVSFGAREREGRFVYFLWRQQAIYRIIDDPPSGYN